MTQVMVGSKHPVNTFQFNISANTIRLNRAHEYCCLSLSHFHLCDMWLISFTCFASIMNEHFFLYPYLHKIRKIFLFFISFSIFIFLIFLQKKKLIARNNCSGILVYFNSLADITFACIHFILFLFLMPTIMFP